MKKLCLLIILSGLVSAGFSQANITFKVDMNSFETFNPANGVYIAGAAPFSWSAGSFTEMTDVDGDSIYEVTMSGVTQTSFDYKFVNGNAWNGTDEKISDAACKGSQTNRGAEISSGTTDTVLSFMYNLCDPAGTYITPTVYVDVTFIVDVEYQNKIFNVDFDKIYVAGEFNAWNDDTASLESQGWMLTKVNHPDSLFFYKGTYNVKGNEEYLFKVLFNNGSRTAKYEQTSNRKLSLGANDQTIACCFDNAEYPCPIPPDPSNITFSIEMPDSIPDSVNVYIMGTFAETVWENNLILMTNSNNDNIFEATVTDIAPGEFFFNFAYGDSSTQIIEYAGDTAVSGRSECLEISPLEDGMYRKYKRRTADNVTLNLQQWGECNVTGIEKNETESTQVLVYPNPFSEYATVVFNNQNHETYQVSVIDITGKIINRHSTNESSFKLNRNSLESGFYFLVLENENNRTVNKLIVE